jgi:hypothetical protein
MNSATNVSWASETREITTFPWVQLTPRVDGSRAWLEAPSLNTNGKPLEIEVYSRIQWIHPTSIPKNPDNQYSLDQLLTEPQNKVAFGDWKNNIDQTLQSKKAELEAEFQKRFDALAILATEKWYNSTDTKSMEDFLLNVIVPVFDPRVVHPWIEDLFLIYWPTQEFFKQFWLDYMSTIRGKETFDQVVSSAASIHNILSTNS